MDALYVVSYCCNRGALRARRIVKELKEQTGAIIDIKLVNFTSNASFCFSLGLDEKILQQESKWFLSGNEKDFIPVEKELESLMNEIESIDSEEGE